MDKETRNLPPKGSEEQRKDEASRRERTEEEMEKKAYSRRSRTGRRRK